MQTRNLHRLAAATLLVHVGVIVWGAYVRVSFSGDGCGDHWPLCNGEAIPTAATTKTLIEYSHRFTSGIAVLLAIVLFVFSRHREKWVKIAASLALVFDFGEAVIGMLLVKWQLVAHNPSIKRAVSGSLHLVNTFFLLAALAAAVWWTRYAPTKDALRRDQKTIRLLSVLSPVLVILVAMSGAVAAFGDTIYRVSTLEEAIRADFSGVSNILIQLRILHPVLAVIGASILWTLSTLVRSGSGSFEPKSSKRIRAFAFAVPVLYLSQLALGALNVVLLAPGWLQLLHLFFAQVLWITLVWWLLDLNVRTEDRDNTNRLGTSEP